MDYTALGSTGMAVSEVCIGCMNFGSGLREDWESTVDEDESVEELAEERGVTMAQIAVAWHCHNEWVDAPIVDVETVDHVEEAVEATEIHLSDSDVEYLEAPYEPTPVSGHD